MSKPSEHPLQRFPLLLTSNSEEYVDSIVRHYGARKAGVLVPERFEGRINYLRLPSLTLAFNSMSVPCTAEYSESSNFKQRFIVTGNARTTVGNRIFDTASQGSFVIAPGQAMESRFSSDFSQLFLAIDPTVIDRKLTALLGTNPKHKLEFVPDSNSSREDSPRLRDLILFLSQQLDETSSPMPAILLNELAEAIIVAFLSVNEHNFSRHLHEDAPSAAPRAVRLAEEYIEANWDRSVSIEELAEVANVSVRSLFRTFRATRNYSPKVFARIVRLRYAKAHLEAATPGTTVTGTALKYGFLSTGHFSDDFRKLFGESPSVTLARAFQTKMVH